MITIKTTDDDQVIIDTAKGTTYGEMLIGAALIVEQLEKGLQVKREALYEDLERIIKEGE